MTTPDIINGLFEFGGAITLGLNVRRLLKDRMIAGVSIVPTAFFAAWGYWNLYYYPHLGQWVSFLGGLGVVIANTVWVVLALYFQRKGRTA